MKKTLLLGVLFLTFISSFSQDLFPNKVVINGSTGNAPYAIASGFVDGDGFADIVIGTQLGNTIEIYINNGDGTFPNTPVLVSNTLTSIGGLKLVDIDGVNGLDILATAYTNDKVTWYPNNGSGVFSTEHVISNTTLGASGLAFGDIDDDGLNDVVSTAYDGDNVVWFKYDGVDTDGFQNASLIDATLSNPGSVNLADIDNDDDLDVIITTAIWPIMSTDVVQIFRNDLYPSGMGTVSWTKVSPEVDNGLRYMFNANFVDLDGDNNLDILATEVENTNNAGSFYYYEDNDDSPFNGSSFSKTTWTTSIGNPSVAQLHDLDGDGMEDIILSNGNQVSSSNQLVWFKKIGAGLFDSEQIIDNTQLNTFVYTVNDFDNDGDLDIASCSFGSDDLTYFENVLETLGLNDNNLRTIRIYPNPVKDILYLNGFNEQINIQIYDLLGKQVLNEKIFSAEPINISDLSPGIYVLRTSVYANTFKIIKQ